MAQDNTSNPEVNLPKPQTNLPKPELDLPLPEKEIPAHLASQGQASGGYRTTGFLKNKVFWGFVIISGLIAFVAGGFYLGNSQSNKQSAQTTPTPSPIPSSSTMNWNKYSWTENNITLFSISYPKNWQSYERISENKKYQTLLFPKGYKYYEVDGKTSHITLAVSDTNPESCRGDCPVIESSSTEIINGLNARKLEGYNGEIGGNIPARYEAIIIENNKKFYIFTLYNKNLEKISAADKEFFNQLLNSLEFTK